MGFFHDVVELVAVDAGFIEWVAATSVWEGKFGCNSDVLVGHLGAVFPGGMGTGGAGDYQIGTHSINVEGCTKVGDAFQVGLGEADGGEKVFGVVDAIGDGGVVVMPAGDESFRLVFECKSPFDDFGSDGDIPGCCNVDGEAESVEELGAEFTFFRVHGSHKHEICWCGM